jgi:hypothetical protein
LVSILQLPFWVNAKPVDVFSVNLKRCIESSTVPSAAPSAFHQRSSLDTPACSEPSLSHYEPYMRVPVRLPEWRALSHYCFNAREPSGKAPTSCRGRGYATKSSKLPKDEIRLRQLMGMCLAADSEILVGSGCTFVRSVDLSLTST